MRRGRTGLAASTGGAAGRAARPRPAGRPPARAWRFGRRGVAGGWPARRARAAGGAGGCAATAGWCARSRNPPQEGRGIPRRLSPRAGLRSSATIWPFVLSPEITRDLWPIPAFLFEPMPLSPAMATGFHRFCAHAAASVHMCVLWRAIRPQSVLRRSGARDGTDDRSPRLAAGLRCGRYRHHGRGRPLGDGSGGAGAGRDPHPPDEPRDRQAGPHRADRHRDDARAQEGDVHELRRDRGAAGRGGQPRRILRSADLGADRAARQADLPSGHRRATGNR